MKATENLGLNLYEPADYILHDSFNSDNEKLDAAITAAHSFHLLLDQAVETAGGAVSFDLSGIDWSRWQAVHLDILGLVNGSGSLNLTFNGDASTANAYWQLGQDYGAGCTLARIVTNSGEDRLWADRITLPVGRRPERLLRTRSSDGCGRHSSLRYSQLQSLELRADTTGVSILAGSRLLVWGED